MRYLPFLAIASLIACSSPPINEHDSNLSDQSLEYEIEDVLINTRDGTVISGMVARKRGGTTPRPVILQYTIYVRDTGRDLETIKRSVDNGYVGMIAYTRGKRFSPAEIDPYEHDADDVYDVIAWASMQEWSDGRVGMYGGSGGPVSEETIQDSAEPLVVQWSEMSFVVIPNLDFQAEENSL